MHTAGVDRRADIGAVDVLDAKEFDFYWDRTIQPILAASKPYLGKFISTASDWTPLKHYSNFFRGYNQPQLDTSDPVYVLGIWTALVCSTLFISGYAWSVVREARRMISAYVMTEHNCRGREVASDPVGLGAYGMDSHNTQRWIKEGHATNEGDVQVRVPKPYRISYRSIVPKEAQCSNLLVPICLSASHIGYGSIRMEPVFMVLGQSAATAACQAIDEGLAVQAVDYAKLRQRLLAERQVLN